VNRKQKTRILSRRMMVLCLVLMLVFIGELLFYTYCRVGSTRLNVAISNERARNRELISTQDSLKVELARLKSPQRIAKIASEQFGLVMPDSGQIILLQD